MNDLSDRLCMLEPNLNPLWGYYERLGFWRRLWNWLKGIKPKWIPGLMDEATLDRILARNDPFGLCRGIGAFIHQAEDSDG